jgi:hypothetical protein
MLDEIGLKEVVYRQRKQSRMEMTGCR